MQSVTRKAERHAVQIEGTVRTVCRWFSEMVIAVLGLIAFILSSITVLLVIAGDYSGQALGFVFCSIGMSMAIFGYHGSFLMFHERRIRNLVWFLPAFLAPFGWLTLAAVAGVGYHIH